MNENIRKRIDTRGAKAEDIKHPGRLTESDILSISPEMAYGWIKQGAWKKRDFVKWLNVFLKCPTKSNEQ